MSLRCSRGPSMEGEMNGHSSPRDHSSVSNKGTSRSDLLLWQFLEWSHDFCWELRFGGNNLGKWKEKQLNKYRKYINELIN